VLHRDGGQKRPDPERAARLTSPHPVDNHPIRFLPHLHDRRYWQFLRALAVNDVSLFTSLLCLTGLRR